MCYSDDKNSHTGLIFQIERVLEQGKLTAMDEKYFLDAMLCNQPITQEELIGITEIFNRLQSGQITLINDKM
ncbi:hypothetical protein [Cyanothece sp. BG0011]|uniref:hypothetical protein n=1 Tax=Cyanothece sp. BG0011 TaxID=2082950 RepID=UPI000D1E7503|nr:hypothetical protein [Cyanothece sp. BG0011]